jgi:hypothetical protein
VPGTRRERASRPATARTIQSFAKRKAPGKAGAIQPVQVRRR